MTCDHTWGDHCATCPFPSHLVRSDTGEGDGGYAPGVLQLVKCPPGPMQGGVRTSQGLEGWCLILSTAQAPPYPSTKDS